MLNSNYLWIAIMCVATLVIMLMIMPGLIDYLHKIKFGQTEREEGLASHKKKNGTPTMGGLAFIIVPTLVYIVCSFFTPFKLDMNAGIILLAFVGYGVVGFIDDYIIVVQKNNEGLKPKYKYLLQSILAVVFFLLYCRNSTTNIWIPLFYFGLFYVYGRNKCRQFDGWFRRSLCRSDGYCLDSFCDFCVYTRCR